MKNTIIYLIGFSGTGKYTIAKALAERTDAIIADNHLCNNPIFTVVAADGIKPLPHGVWREIRKIRDAVLNAMAYLAEKEANFILTNELIEGVKGDRKLYEEVEDLAETRQARLVPVRLICRPEELLIRVAMPERKTRHKAIDPGALRERIAECAVLKPEHPNLLELDVTQISPQDAAVEILEHIGKLKS